MPFKAVASASPAPEGPLHLFDELPRMPGSIPELWRQQGKILDEYAESFADKTDVAVELPTGTGKTIVGLLIGDWRRRKHRRPVLYACPTHQLVHQVAAVARQEGNRPSRSSGRTPSGLLPMSPATSPPRRSALRPTAPSSTHHPRSAIRARLSSTMPMLPSSTSPRPGASRSAGSSSRRHTKPF